MRREVFIPVTQQPNSGLGHLIVEVSRSHTHTHTAGRAPLDKRSVRRKSLYLPNTDQTQDTNILPSTGFEPAIPAIKRLEICAEGEVTTIKSVCRPFIEG